MQTLKTHPNLVPVVKRTLAMLAPPPDQTVSEWADENRRLSRESSAEPGHWDTSRAEYQRGIMDAFTDPAVHTIVVMSSAQVGKTEIINNCVGYVVSNDPGPILLLQPTLEMGHAWSKDRLAPMLRDTPCLTGRVKDPRSRDSGNTLLHKTFPGGHITIAGANSPAGLASRPIRYVFADELDRYPFSAGGHGDPVDQAIKRTTAFWNRKIVLVSTPVIKGASRIEAAFEESDQRRFYVPCPDCGATQYLKWAQVKWDKNTDGRHLPETARYECEACGSGWNDVQKTQAIRQGQWIATRPNSLKPDVVGFHLNEIYSPWVPLARMVSDFLAAHQHPERLKTWVNTALGESFEEAHEAMNASALLESVEEFGPELPEPVLVLTAGVDTQNDRLEAQLIGWGEGFEFWVHEYRVFPGDPAKPEVWQSLSDWLVTPRRHALGFDKKIDLTFIDSGGHHSHQVYNFCLRRIGNAYPIKGTPTFQGFVPNRPVKTKTSGVLLYPINVNEGKDTLSAWLSVLPSPGPQSSDFAHPLPEGEGENKSPGRPHFRADVCDVSYFDQLTAEVKKLTYHKGFPTTEWHLQKGRRNEALDTWVYAYAAAFSLRPAWGIIRKRHELKTGDHTGSPLQKTDEEGFTPLPPPRPPFRPPTRKPRGFAAI